MSCTHGVLMSAIMVHFLIIHYPYPNIHDRLKALNAELNWSAN
jgi:hypothetical protein